MVWFSLSYFLFYGLYPSLIYKKVVKEGNHTILFIYLSTILDLYSASLYPHFAL